MADPVLQSSSSSDVHFQQTDTDILDFQTIFLLKCWSNAKESSLFNFPVKLPRAAWVAVNSSLGCSQFTPPLFFCHSLNFLFHFVLKQWWWVLYRYLVPRKWREFYGEVRTNWGYWENSYLNRIRLHKFNCFMKLLPSKYYILIIYCCRAGERACSEWWLMQYI